MDESPAVNRNVFAFLFAVSILHLVFAFTVLMAHAVARFGETPYGLFIDEYTVFGFLVQVALNGITIYAGLYLGRSVGLGAPLLEGWARREPVQDRALTALKIALAVGLGVAAAKYLMDLLVFSPFTAGTLSGLKQVPAMFLLPIPFQQGIGDEIVSRLFWMTLIVWILWKIRGSGNAPLKDSMYWVGILLVGLIPILGLILTGTAGLVILQYAAIILVGAIPFGCLYWKKGIESALVAHFISSLALVLLSLW